jgi:hypothetical protein
VRGENAQHGWTGGEFMKNCILPALFGLGLLAALPAGADTASFNFTTTNITGQSYGDVLTISPTGGSTISGLTNVQVSAFSTSTIVGDSGSTPVSAAAVDEYSGAGLGVCGTNEGTGCTSPLHQVDNIDNGYEFVLFKFDTPVDLSTVTLYDYSGSDMDMSYWTSTSFPSFSTLSALTSLSSQTNDLCNSNCSTGDTITDSLTTNGGTSSAGVSYLLIAAAYNTGNNNDTFKIQGLTLVGTTSTTTSPTPEPATFGLIGLALAALGLLRRKHKLN